MPEGDTLFRTAGVLRYVLVGRDVVAARGRVGGAQLERVVGSVVEGVDSNGKHLLIRFSSGHTLHTHLGMHGSWHRYRPGERWRRDPSRAVAVVEVAGAVAACFDAPTVELLDTRAVGLHPALAGLGPDLLAREPDLAGALGSLRSSSRATMPVGEALLDQTAVAGIGNVYRSEVCFIERVDPFQAIGELRDDVLRRLLETARRLLAANTGGGERVTRPGGGCWVYGRTGRPCYRCGALVRSRVSGQLPRRTYWCPGCQHTEGGVRGIPSRTVGRAGTASTRPR